jgi:hypothetical protein
MRGDGERRRHGSLCFEHHPVVIRRGREKLKRPSRECFWCEEVESPEGRTVSSAKYVMEDTQAFVANVSHERNRAQRAKRQIVVEAERGIAKFLQARRAVRGLFQRPGQGAS